MTQPERFHAFDGLRAAMMLLGVALHSATAYAVMDNIWWLKDPRTSQGMDALVLFIHTFRLPAFFVMAGFFASLLAERRGRFGFLENRMSRLGLPFLLGMIAMYPFLKIASVWQWFAFRQPDPAPWSRVLGWLAEDRLARSLEPMHLWFLEVLMWTCLAAAAATPLLNRLRADWFRRLLRSAWGLPLMTLATAIPYSFMPYGFLDTPHNFAPVISIQWAYAVFFVFGWGLYRNRELLPALERHGWGKVALAVPAAFFALGMIRLQMAAPKTPHLEWRLGSALLNAVSAWLMIFGLIGLFLRLASHPSRRWRYLSDAAYWMYLTHPVVLVAVQIPMLSLDIPCGVKFVLGCAAAYPILLWTYDRWVRSTWIGLVLNGKRQPRWSGADADLARRGNDVVETPGQGHPVNHVDAPALPAAYQPES